MLPTRAAAIAAAATCAAIAKRSGSPSGALQEMRALFAKYNFVYNQADAVAVTLAFSDGDDADLTAFFGEAGAGEFVAIGEVFKTPGTADTTDDALATAKGSAVAAGDRFMRSAAAAVVFISAAAATLAAVDAELIDVSQADAQAAVMPTRAAVISAAGVVADFCDLTSSRSGYLQEARAVFEDYRSDFADDLANAAARHIHDTKDANLTAFFVAGGGGQQILSGEFMAVSGTADTTNDAFETAKGTAPAAGNVFQRTGAASIDFIGASASAAAAALDDAVAIDVTDEADATILAFLDTDGEGEDLAAGDFFSIVDTHDTADNGFAGLKGSGLVAGDVFFVTSATACRFICTAAAKAATLASLEAAESVTVSGADLAAFFAGGQGSGLAVGDRFVVDGNGDTTDNALQTAKGSAVADGDVFQRSGAAAVIFIAAGDADLSAVDEALAE